MAQTHKHANAYVHAVLISITTEDFRKRFVSMLGYDFRSFHSSTALAVLRKKIGAEEDLAPEGAPDDGVCVFPGNTVVSSTHHLITQYSICPLHKY